jgi:hypothetical protein
MTFEQWIESVEAFVFNQVGMRLSQIPDQTYHFWFADDWSPVEAGLKVLSNAGFLIPILTTVG